MALSNILNEPRRELTESAVGTGALCVLLALDYLGAKWFESVTGGAGHGGCPWQLGMLVFVPAIAAICVGVGLFLAHAIGEGICNALARRGLELRPKDRCRG